MRKPIIDHSWNSILEGDELAKICLIKKIEQLVEMSDTIRSHYDENTVANVMDNGNILYALNKALEYLEDPNSPLTETDFYIYYSFASDEAKNSERIIDEELSELGL